jgi:hypothetical protein
MPVPGRIHIVANKKPAAAPFRRSCQNDGPV